MKTSGFYGSIGLIGIHQISRLIQHSLGIGIDNCRFSWFAVSVFAYSSIEGVICTGSYVTIRKPKSAWLKREKKERESNKILLCQFIYQ